VIRAIIFDFDGTILDTEWPLYVAWRDVYASHGCELPESLWLNAIGTNDGFDSYAHLERLIARPIDRKQVRSAIDTRFLELANGEPLLPGVTDYLAAAKGLGLRVGLASSSSRSWIDSFLVPRELRGYFETIRCADDVERVKPHPEVYLRAVNDLGASASETLALEDSAHGLAAAKAAGLRCVVVPNRLTRTMDFSLADAVLPSLAYRSLADVIRDLGGAS
jgi:HAD superfamily hydrolase (TIGR01509 family)